MSVQIDLPPRPVHPAQRRVQPAPTISEEEEKAASAAESSQSHRSWQQGRGARNPSPDEDEDDQPDCIDHARLWLQRWTLIFMRYPLTERVAHFAYIRSLYLQALLCLIAMMVRTQRTRSDSTAPLSRAWLSAHIQLSHSLLLCTPLVVLSNHRLGHHDVRHTRA